jgi:hypothetical protein
MYGYEKHRLNLHSSHEPKSRPKHCFRALYVSFS